ncbi:hypothetical protein KKG24_05715, partial [Patescibacteria group bacterium]|nr:hypothetical protein [Patescibacteria group bacterium]
GDTSSTQIYSGNILARINNSFDLGSATRSWANVYASGTAYVATDVKVGGVSVCLQNGTNCPAGATTDLNWTYNLGNDIVHNATPTTDIVIGGYSAASAPVFFSLIGTSASSNRLILGQNQNMDLVVGATTSSGMNSAFQFSGNDLYVQGNIGSASSVYTNGAFVAGASLSLSDNGIVDSNGDMNFTSVTDGFNFNLGGGGGDDFIVDTTTFVVESDNNRVGIGTAAPSESLHVSGGNVLIQPVKADGYISSLMVQSTKSSATDAAMEVQSTPSGGEMRFFRDNSSAVLLSGVDDSYFNSDAKKLGVGTTSPGGKLEVEVDNGENTAGLLLDMNDSSNNPNVLVINNAGTGYSILADEGDVVFDANAIVGGSTSRTETLSHTGFVMGGNDLFVAGMAGIEGDIYTDGSIYTSGTIQVATDVVVGGRSVCLSDGTNCPASSGSATDLNWTYSLANDLVYNATATTDIAIGSSSTASAPVFFSLTGASASSNRLIIGQNQNMDVVIGNTTGTISSTGFQLSGNDFYVAGDAGVEGRIYSDTGVTVVGTVYEDGLIESSGALSINTTNNQNITTGSGWFTSVGNMYAYGDEVIIGNAVTDILTVKSTIQNTPDGFVLSFEGATPDEFETSFVITDPTGDRTITFQNGSGIVAFTSDIPTNDLNWVYDPANEMVRNATTTMDVALGSFSTSTAPVFFSLTGASASSNRLIVGQNQNMDLVVGATTSSGMNSLFQLSGNDIFVQGNIGSASSVYTNGAFVAGSAGTYYGDGFITRTSGGLAVNLAGGAGDDFSVGTSTFVVESDNNRVGIGTAAPTVGFEIRNKETLFDYDFSGTSADLYPVRVTVDTTSGDINNSVSSFTSNLTIGGNVDNVGHNSLISSIGFSLFNSSANHDDPLDNIIGVKGTTWSTGSGNVNRIIGVYGEGAQYNWNSANVSTTYGVLGDVWAYGVGTITDAAGLVARVSDYHDAFTPTQPLITNAYGLYVNNINTAANNYGIYVAGGSTYGLWVDSGNVRFDNNLVVGGNTASTGTLSNTAFQLTGNDLFVADSIGAEGNIYTDGSIYTSGTIQVATDVVVGGQSVCLADGTNCPSGFTETDTLLSVTNRGSVATATLTLYGGLTASNVTATGTTSLSVLNASATA